MHLVMLNWAREQATKRGFPPSTNKRIHIVIDGEKCLEDGLRKHFPTASFALDIRHLESKIWKTGRTFYPEGSQELEHWVEERKTLLYSGQAEFLLVGLEELYQTLSKRAKRDKNKREQLTKLIEYMKKRLNMMNYKQLLEEDLVIASGIVEGAARYVVGERMDCSGMRWIPERGEALLRLRCIELNGDWDSFFDWGYQRWLKKLRQAKRVVIKTNEPLELPVTT